MAMRRASAYSKHLRQPFCRKSKKRSKDFVKGAPPVKIVKFFSGNQEAFKQGKFDTLVRLCTDEQVQVRDIALEACRRVIIKLLDKKLAGNYYFVITRYPHHVLRENKQAAVAQADRYFSGMSHAWGKPLCNAVQAKRGMDLFRVWVESKNIAIAKEALRRAKAKIPGSTSIKIEPLTGSK